MFDRILKAATVTRVSCALPESINRVVQGDAPDSTSQEVPEVPGALFVPLWPQEGLSSPAEEG